MQRCQRVSLTASLALSLSVGLASISHADVHLPHIFGNQMVLQRDLPVRVWGTADADEKVTVSIGQSEAHATADSAGKWKVELPALKVGEPVEVKVEGKNTITLRDVLVGEVWLCSGQSNMQMTVGGSDHAKEEILSANHPQIRLFTVPMRPAEKPADDVDAYWKPCTPESIPQFSAVAYFFGRKLQKDLGVPIGLINSSWGGTRIEPWTPPAGFQAVPAVTSILTNLEKNPVKIPGSTPSRGRRMRKTAPSQAHQTPTYLYNGMIHALVPFAIRGAIWYQGESNLADGALYQEKMKALIAGWRSVWNEGDFPFEFVQLASFHYGNDPTLLPKLWEAQTATLTSVANTGMAVITDVSNLKDIHPKDKQDVGKRLALWALAKTYGREGIIYSGPLYKSMNVDGSAIRIQFDHAAGGLKSRGGKPLDWFTIAGDDKQFVEATAKIEGDSILVSSPKVEKPAAVRFAWSQDAEPNLENKAGLPASSFRTDHW